MNSKPNPKKDNNNSNKTETDKSSATNDSPGRKVKVTSSNNKKNAQSKTPPANTQIKTPAKNQSQPKASSTTSRSGQSETKKRKHAAPDQNSEEAKFISDMENTKHKKWSEKLLLTDYMKEFILKAGERAFVCVYCKGDVMKKSSREYMYCENMWGHVSTDWHKSNTPQEEKEELDDLIKAIQIELEKKGSKSKKISKEEQEKIDTENYLKFVAMAVSERLSFEQTSKIANFLRGFYQKKQMGFLKRSFKPTTISKVISKCFRPSILEDIYQDLEQNVFSFSVDNCTMIGKNYCGLKIKYIKDTINEFTQESEQMLINRIVALVDLKTSSEGKDIHAIVKEKILIKTQIKENLIGFTSDNASSLKSDKNGLAGLLQNDESLPSLYCLSDPCHGANLAVKHSLKSLPSEITDFIDDLHSYFAFPQRKSKLLKLQEEEKKKPLLLKNYVKTRWLSLGLSLKRLLDIWDSIRTYMTKIAEKKKKLKAKLQGFKLLMENNSFYLTIYLLHFLISKINTLSIKLQDQSFPIGTLNFEIELCFRSILQIICQSSIYEMNLENLTSLNWEDEKIQEQCFLGNEKLIDVLSMRVNSSFTSFPTQDFEDFSKTFKNFIGKLLNLLIKYLPFNNKILTNLSFIEFNAPYEELITNIQIFNNCFGIFDQQYLTDKIFPQVLALRTFGFNKYKTSSKESPFLIWNNISKSQKYPDLCKIARFALTLPTSSSNIEQAFSLIKLYRTSQRNRLKDETLEGLTLMKEEYKNLDKIVISSKVINRYNELVITAKMQRESQVPSNETDNDEYIRIFEEGFENLELSESEDSSDDEEEDEELIGGHIFKKTKLTKD